MANVLLNADLVRQSNLAQLPLFSGDSKDLFTAEQWIERVNRARITSAWDEDHTNTFIYNALRGNALLWYDSLRRTGINRDDWDQFRAAFLESWSAVRTTRTATVNLSDLKQGQNEPVTAFYPRVVKAVDDLEALIPGLAFPLPDPAWPQAFTDIGAFAALPQATRDAAAATLVRHGATSAFNHMALNLFISNLKPSLRDELLKSLPNTLYAAFQQAIMLERLAVEPKRSTLPAMPVDTTPTTDTPIPATTDPADTVDALDAQIDALNTKRRQLQQRGNQRASSSSNRSSSNNNAPARFANRPPATRDTICHYCKKPGHYQIDCRTRQRNNAQCVRTAPPAGHRPSGPGPQGYPAYPPRPGPVHHVEPTPFTTQVDQIPYFAPYSLPMSSTYMNPSPQDFHYTEG
jgi:hypothetical protein